MALTAVLLTLLATVACGVDVRPPKYTPGDVISKTDFSSVDDALTEVLKAGSKFVLEDRRVAIGIANEGVTDLTNPVYHLEYGRIFSSPPPDIKPGQTGLNLAAKKTSHLILFGTNGVITYQIADTDYILAVAWDVPYYVTVDDIKFNVKIYPKGYGTDKQMLKQMMEYAGPFKAVGWQERREYGIKLRASMTNNIQSKLYVYIDATESDRDLSPERHRDCSFNPLWLGSFCWHECDNLGWCWENQKCGSVSDCVAPMECYSKCGQ